MGSSVSGREDGGFKILSGSASNGTIGATSPSSRLDEATRPKDSLEGRIRELSQESIRQAMLRIVRELLPGDKDAVEIIDNAYALRSKILHDGASDPYLGRKVSAVEDTIRRIYSARIGKTLKVPPLNLK